MQQPTPDTDGADLDAKEQACAGALAEKVGMDMNDVSVNSHDTAADGNTVGFLKWGENDQASCEVNGDLDVKSIEPLGVTTF